MYTDIKINQKSFILNEQDFNYRSALTISSLSSSGLSDPPVYECQAPFNCCHRSVYCKNIEGKCTWGNHGDCY